MTQGKMYNLFGKSGAMEEIPDTPVLMPYTELRVGPSETRAAVIGTESDGTIKAITLTDKPMIRTYSKCDNLRPMSKKFGIGSYYYDDLRTVPFAEVETAMFLYDQQKVEEHIASQLATEQYDMRVEIGRKLFADNEPAKTTGLIMACLREDKSDPMTDYFGHGTKRCVILAFSFSTRENFAEMRTACRNSTNPDIIAIADMSKDEAEHRENYTGGEGYYLGKSKYSGWIVKKVNYGQWTKPETLYSHAGFPDGFCAFKQSAAPAPTITETVCITFNLDKGGIEIKFPAKPSDAVLAPIRDSKIFRWSKYNRLWYSKDTPTARAIAAHYGKLPELPAPGNQDNYDSFDNHNIDQQWDAIK